MYLRTIKCIDEGNKYDIDVRNHKKHINLLEECRNDFKYPYLYHFISGIEPEYFNHSRFAENFKREFKKTVYTEMKSKWNQVPSYLAMYGLEYSLGDERKISGDYSLKTTWSKREDYHHIHLFLCFDCCNEYRIHEIPSLVLTTLTNIKGLYKPNYAKRKNTEKYCHDLNEEFNDAVSRIQYISKIDQKENVPYRKKNNHFKSIQCKYS